MPYEAPPPGASGSAANGTVQVCNSSNLAKSCDSSDFFYYFFFFYDTKQSSGSILVPPRFILCSSDFFFERERKRFDVALPGEVYAS